MDSNKAMFSFTDDITTMNISREWNSIKGRLSEYFNSVSQVQDEGFLFNMNVKLFNNLFILLELSCDEIAQFKRILQKVEDVCLPNFLLTYNRYKFFTRELYANESCVEYVKELVKLHRSCEFDTTENMILKEVIVDNLSDLPVCKAISDISILDYPMFLDICYSKCSCALKGKQSKCHTPPFLDSFYTGTEVEVKDRAADRDLLQNAHRDRQGTNAHDVLSLKSEETPIVKELKLDVSENNFKSEKAVRIDKAKEVLVAETVPAPRLETLVEPGNSPCKELSRKTLINSIVEKTKYCRSFVSNKELTTRLTSRPRRNIKIPLKLRSDGNELTQFCANSNTNKAVGNEKNNHCSCVRSTSHKILNSSNKKMPKEKEKRSESDKMSVRQERTLNATQESGKTSQNTNFQCLKCNSTFKSFAALNRHKYSHKGEYCNTFSVHKYKIEIPLLEQLTLHRKKSRPKSQIFACGDKCGKLFSQKHHQHIQTGEKPFQCNNCSQSFTRKGFRHHAGERPYRCEVCDKTFSDVSGWQNHQRIHANEKLSCNVCDNGMNPCTPMVSMKMNGHQGHFSCSTSTKCLPDKGKHMKHLKKHQNVEGEKQKQYRYNCQTCNKKFRNSTTLKSHCYLHTGEKPYSCTECGASFIWLAAFKRHEQTHTRTKPYTCEICGSSFADKAYLKRHKLNHSGERPYKCDLCQRTFVVEYDLKQHTKIHLGLKSFMCEVCGAAFVRKCYLYKHRRIHYGKKKHACDLCDRKFYEPHRLRNHRKRHENAANRQLKKFICDVCGKIFAKKIYLTKHVMTHTGNKPYVCMKCPAKFVDSFKLKRHLITHEKGTSKKRRTVYDRQSESLTDQAKDSAGHTAALDGSPEPRNRLTTAHAGHSEKVGLQQGQIQSACTDNSVMLGHHNEIHYVLEESSKQPQQQVLVRQRTSGNQTSNNSAYEIIIVEIPNSSYKSTFQSLN